MPLLANLAIAIAYFFRSALVLLFGAANAEKILVIGVFAALQAAYFAAITTCMTTLLGYIASFGSGSATAARFLMGLGMFIPSNAVAVISCVGSVWLATLIMRYKRVMVEMAA